MGGGFSGEQHDQRDESQFVRERREAFERFPDLVDRRSWWRKPPSKWFVTWWSNLLCTKKYRVLMIGLDSAGKTTILHKLLSAQIKPAESDTILATVPTVGFNVESIVFPGGGDLDVWDVGGQKAIRPLWRHYYHGTGLIIFVVDSTDVARINEAREELHFLAAQDELSDAYILVYANKQDLPHAIDAEVLSDWLELDDLQNDKWHIQPCSGTLGDGLFPGLEWYVNPHWQVHRRPRAEKSTLTMHIAFAQCERDGYLRLSGRLLSGEEVVKDLTVSFDDTWASVSVRIAPLLMMAPHRLDFVLPNGESVTERHFTLADCNINFLPVEAS